MRKRLTSKYELQSYLSYAMLFFKECGQEGEDVRYKNVATLLNESSRYRVERIELSIIYAGESGE